MAVIEAENASADRNQNKVKPGDEAENASARDELDSRQHNLRPGDEESKRSKQFNSISEVEELALNEESDVDEESERRQAIRRSEDQQTERRQEESDVDEESERRQPITRSEDQQTERRQERSISGRQPRGNSTSITIPEDVSQPKCGTLLSSWLSIEVCLQILLIIFFIILLFTLKVWPTITGANTDEVGEIGDVEEYFDNHADIVKLSSGELLSS